MTYTFLADMTLREPPSGGSQFVTRLRACRRARGNQLTL